MTKLNRWPGEYHRPPKAEVELFPDFDQTIAGRNKELDDTVRNLRIIREHSTSNEDEQRYQFKAIADLTESAKEQAAMIQRVVTALKTKSSKQALADFETNLTAKIEKRLDNIFKLVSVLGVIFALILAVIGWGVRH